jgi:hypothetical protein
MILKDKDKLFLKMIVRKIYKFKDLLAQADLLQKHLKFKKMNIKKKNQSIFKGKKLNLI